MGETIIYEGNSSERDSLIPAYSTLTVGTAKDLVCLISRNRCEYVLARMFKGNASMADEIENMYVKQH